MSDDSGSLDEPADATGPLPPAGYYPDPESPGLQRYWDGQAWGPPAPQPAPTGPGQVVVVQNAGTNGMAVASMVLGILWIYWLGSLLAVIFGHVALGQLKRPDNPQGGRGMAIAGLVLGYIGLGLLALVLVVVFIAAANDDGALGASVLAR